MPIRDANLDLSPQATDIPMIVTNRMSASTLDLEGTPLKGMAVRVNLGYTVGNTAVLTGTFNVIAHGASSTPVSSSDPIVGQFDAAIIVSSETAGYTVEKIFPVHTNYRYLRLEFAVATLAASDSPSFSQVEAYLVPQVERDWDRNINFH